MVGWFETFEEKQWHRKPIRIFRPAWLTFRHGRAGGGGRGVANQFPKPYESIVGRGGGRAVFKFGVRTRTSQQWLDNVHGESGLGSKE